MASHDGLNTVNSWVIWRQQNIHKHYLNEKQLKYVHKDICSCNLKIGIHKWVWKPKLRKSLLNNVQKQNYQVTLPVRFVQLTGDYSYLKKIWAKFFENVESVAKSLKYTRTWLTHASLEETQAHVQHADENRFKKTTVCKNEKFTLTLWKKFREIKFWCDSLENHLISRKFCI